MFESRTASTSRFSFFRSSAVRLLAGAAVLHIALAIGLAWAGRTQVAPDLIDRYGIVPSVAFDSYEYRQSAINLSLLLRQGALKRWATAPEPLHTKPISICFLLIRPLFGYSALTAEPFNLLCYLAIIALTLALGREIGGPRVGFTAAILVALWPTLLLHTLQLLKDPLVIVAALAFILCATTWLTRTYNPRQAIVALVGVTITLPVVVLVRSSFLIAVTGIICFAIAFLLIRQIVEKRILYWNMVAPVAIVIGAVALVTLVQPNASRDVVKNSSVDNGQSKTTPGVGQRVTSAVVYAPLPEFEQGPPTVTNRFKARAHRTAIYIGSVRYRYVAYYTRAGSNIDTDVGFDDVKGVVRYLPRALMVGTFAPFPRTWGTAGARVGRAGKLISAGETLVIYGLALFALIGSFRQPHRLATWFLLLSGAFGTTLLGLVIPNVGALYRLRYIFWLVLIVVGVRGVHLILKSRLARTTPEVSPKFVEAAVGGGGKS